LLGTTVQHFLTMDRERREAFREQQIEAYGDFLNALDKSRVARDQKEKGNENKARELEIAFELEGGAAFRRVAIYGDRQVVTAMAEWSRQSSSLPPCPAHWEADLKVWQFMREASLGTGQSVSDRDLGELALFCSPMPE